MIAIECTCVVRDAGSAQAARGLASSDRRATVGDCRRRASLACLTAYCCKLDKVVFENFPVPNEYD